MPRYFKKLRGDLEAYLDKEKIEHIYQAYLCADRAHKGQKRRSGEPYISHPVAVARILVSMRMDYQSIMAAILHDVIEDTGVEKDAVSEQFGESVAELVDGVSKLTQISFETRAEAQAENFRKMVLAMVRDIRVILIKLADRLHNMRTLGAMPEDKKKRIARETLDIYAPIANRLGMHNFRIELEDLGFHSLYPMRARILKEAVRRARGNRKEVLTIIENALKKRLIECQYPACRITGREKHLYSIYKKMKTKGLSFSEIMDVYAFRLVVDKVDTAYRILGAVHNLYKPVPERFKDYIAIPKANGYQSLHTTLFGPYGVPIEIQIRTEAMDRMAENGIAAHWLYKADGDEVGEQAHTRARRWLKSLLEMQQSTGNSLEFIEHVKVDLFPDEVYVFTPKGGIMELPAGATAVDFAYTVHSDVGNHCVAAKIDRHLAPLSTLLSNGQTVEIITAPGARPNPAWLSFVVTGKARSNIRHFLKSQQTSESIVLGRRLLEQALAALDSSWEVLGQARIDAVLTEMQVESLDNIFESIGLGNQMPAVAARRLVQASSTGTPSTANAIPLSIKGTEGMVVRFARCCRPIPGDPIVGFLSAGRGIMVHADWCRNVGELREQPEKSLSVCWADKIEQDFPVEVSLEASNQRGVLATISIAIAEEGSNIEDIRVDERDGRSSVIHIILSVRGRGHLGKVLKRIRTVGGVMQVSRSNV